MASSHLLRGLWAKEMVTQEVTIFSATWSPWAGTAMQATDPMRFHRFDRFDGSCNAFRESPDATE